VTRPPEATGRGETTHVSVMDGEGNIVSLTQSIERSFGAAVVTAGLGFIHNGYLRAFKVRNRRHPHYLRPGAPARSNAAPTIVFRDGRPWAALGSTGSERIGSGIFEVLLRLRRDRPFDAVHGPRLHATPQRHVLWEGERFPEGSREALLERGFTVESLGPYSFQVGGLQLATREGATFTGVAEPRRDGAAAGPGTGE
jgi:gamma-glutamyltranspeptidase/glutathione hydrolase